MPVGTELMLLDTGCTHTVCAPVRGIRRPSDDRTKLGGREWIAKISTGPAVGPVSPKTACRK